MNEQDLRLAIEKYRVKYESEEETINVFLDFDHNHIWKYSRRNEFGHYTGSAFIVNQDYTKVLLVLHGKLNKWLQPGGHADGNTDLFEVACKEMEEETGVRNFTIKTRDIFDMDRHKIPEHKGVKDHFHYDIRFLFVIRENEPLKISNESKELRWINVDEIQDFTKDESMMRMIRKALEFYHSDKRLL